MAIAKAVKDMYSYEVIYLGYPNWYGTIPMAVFTFLEAYDFSGKIIVPYCTHAGSGTGSSERNIKKICPNAKMLSGLMLQAMEGIILRALIKPLLISKIVSNKNIKVRYV